MLRHELVVGTKLHGIAERARSDPTAKFHNVAHLLDKDLLRQCFYALRRDGAVGIDGVTWEAYEQDLNQNLENLVARMKAKQYRPQPVRRAYIPKDEKSKRPLGIPALEDKLVQMGISLILEAIYEQDFLEVSYGFRRGRGCHDALFELHRELQFRPVNWVVDADIKAYFDTVDHDCLVKCLGVRFADRNLMSLIVRFLKAGVMEDGAFQATDEGTPQGGNLSPMLANIFLHYVLDRWFEKQAKPKLNGYAVLFRYADDFVICVQYEYEAKLILQAVKRRFEMVGLTLSPEKTRLVRFGRVAYNRWKRGSEKPGTFDFLGFTHYCAESRTGRYKVGQKTSRKKFRMKVTALNQWLRTIRNAIPTKDWWQRLRQKLLGHYRYYGVSGNWQDLQRFYRVAQRLARKWLNRRDQKGYIALDQWTAYLARYPLPKPRIYHHFYQRLYAARGV